MNGCKGLVIGTYVGFLGFSFLGIRTLRLRRECRHGLFE